MGDRPVRLTVILTGTAHDAMHYAAALTGDRRTDVVNKALVLYAQVVDLDALGREFCVSDRVIHVREKAPT